MTENKRPLNIEGALTFISEYYNRKMSPKMQGYYLSKLEQYPEITVKKALADYMDAEPRFPKLVDLYPYLKKHDNRPENIEYYRDTDNRFPVGKLWEAFNILSEKGRPEFDSFCDKVKMPVDDRQRVICKKGASRQ